MQPSNLLKIESLNDDWRDKDSILLHACFQLLKDFVEKEDLALGNTDWNADEKHRLAKAEIDECISGGLAIPNQIHLKRIALS